MAIEIVLAYILDLILGDPRWFPHPVKGIGLLIKKLEPPLRKVFRNERIGGIILVVSVISISWYFSFIIIKAAFSINRYLGFLSSIFIIYSSLAAKDLDVESMEVYRPLERKDIALARKKLSLIVGRDTNNLGYQEVIRATVETIAENIVDGIISPLFYAFIGGAPLALAYKAVNTLDSMVGYKNEKYINFGWASAKIDTLANFIPARLSILFLSLASLFAGKDAANSWRMAARDGRNNPSLNSGIPEACVAGALGVRLGGLNYYGSKPALKPFIGDEINALKSGHIKDSIKISYICSALFLITGVFLITCIG
ncbi:MAG: adenosylcobinamide-phosphate synthase CbiB [Nitrospirota bacterium]